jgi:hypothetical protein
MRPETTRRSRAAGLTRVDERILRRPRRVDQGFGTQLALGDIARDGHMDFVDGAAGNGSGSTTAMSTDTG